MLRIFHNTHYDFIKWWRVAAIATAAFIALGLGSISASTWVRSARRWTR
jgi:preprotein translocase subunit SecF